MSVNIFWLVKRRLNDMDTKAIRPREGRHSSRRRYGGDVLAIQRSQLAFFWAQMDDTEGGGMMGVLRRSCFAYEGGSGLRRHGGLMGSLMVA